MKNRSIYTPGICIHLLCGRLFSQGHYSRCATWLSCLAHLPEFAITNSVQNSVHKRKASSICATCCALRLGNATHISVTKAQIKFIHQIYIDSLWLSLRFFKILDQTFFVPHISHCKVTPSKVDPFNAAAALMASELLLKAAPPVPLRPISA